MASAFTDIKAAEANVEAAFRAYGELNSQHLSQRAAADRLADAASRHPDLADLVASYRVRTADEDMRKERVA